MSRDEADLLVSTSETNKLQSNKLFSQKLSPLLPKQLQLNCVFDELFQRIKSFWKHVKSQLKDAFWDELHREV